MASRNGNIFVGFAAALLLFFSTIIGGQSQGSNALVPAIITFGDSSVDVGNNDYIHTLFKADFPPYGRDFKNHQPTGRFCNGKLATDLTAETLGFTTFPPAYLSPQASGNNLLIGANFASAGSGYYDHTAIMSHVIPLSQQLEFYKEYQSKLANLVGSKKASSILSGALYLVSSGSSDFIQNYYVNPYLYKFYTPDEFSSFLITIFTNFIKDLYGLGARKIGVTSLPPLGCVPASITLYGCGSNKCVSRLNVDAQGFNKKLNAAANSLAKQLPNLKIAVFDIYTPLLDLVSNPSKSERWVVVVNGVGDGDDRFLSSNRTIPISSSSSSSYISLLKSKMELLVRGNRDIKPFLLKLGFALTLSFAGFFISHLRSRCRSRPHSAIEADAGGKGLKDELCILKSDESLAKIINGTSTTTTTTTTTTTFVGLSPTSMSSGDEEGFLLPEFNDLLLKEFDASGRVSDATPTSLITPKKAETREETAMEQEIVQLKNLVMSLRERERSLELQLLEFYGLQEQEAIVRELESQVKINTMESKLFSLKAESLQSENQRLRAQLLDCLKTVAELDAARAKVKSLKRKLKSDEEEAGEKMAVLQRKISILQSKVEMDEKNHADFETKLKRQNESEDEVLNLRMLNSRLAQENFELNQKLEDSLLEGPEAEALEEAKDLREANDKLTKEIEQLQTDRCTDVEELVYLRWVNACLRYEMRNYQPPPGKTVARDLSKTLSPKSEEKAKQLIVEYANSGADEKTLNPMDSDMDYYCYSQGSTGESDDTSNDTSFSARSTSSKSKFLSKLKKLVLGKDTHGNRPLADRTHRSCSDSDRRMSFSSYSVDDMIGRDSCNSSSPSMTEELGQCNQLSGMEEAQIGESQRKKHVQTHGRPSLDIQRLRSLNLEEDSERKGEHKSNIGRSYSFRRMSSLDESTTSASQSSLIYAEDTDSPEKVELKKFAEVLKKSRGIPRN